MISRLFLEMKVSAWRVFWILVGLGFTSGLFRL